MDGNPIRVQSSDPCRRKNYMSFMRVLSKLTQKRGLARTRFPGEKDMTPRAIDEAGCEGGHFGYLVFHGATYWLQVRILLDIGSQCCGV